jgi:hypothetical protein
MHSWEGEHTIIHHNGDCSGDWILVDTRTGKELEVHGEDLIRFMIQKLQRAAIGYIEGLDLVSTILRRL